jgi:transposase-like protein
MFSAGIIASMKEKAESKHSNHNGHVVHSRAEKLKHLQLWEQSGLSGIAYARRNGLHDNALYAWRSKCLKSSKAVKRTDKVAQPAFVSVEVPRSSTLQVTLRLQGMELSVTGCAHQEECIQFLSAFAREVGHV